MHCGKQVGNVSWRTGTDILSMHTLCFDVSECLITHSDCFLSVEEF